MSIGEIGWIIFLAGLPFAPLLERRLDLWHGHSMYTALWLGILFGLSIFTKDRKVTYGNKPLAAWLIFTWVWVLWTFMQTIINSKQYNLVLFIPMLHILSIGLFYLSAKTFWGREAIGRIFKALAISGSIMVVYGVVQSMNIDPLFKDLATNVKTKSVVGMIGNPSHFGVYLALILPIFWLYKNPLSAGIQIAISYILCVLAHRYGAVAGLLSAGAAFLTLCAFKNKKVASIITIFGVALVIGLFVFHDHFRLILSDSGRFRAWEKFGQLTAQSPFFGIGPGSIQFISQSIKSGPLFQWRHVHNEFLQITIEQGVLGLGLVLWFMYDTVKRIIVIKSDSLTPILASICAAFVVSCLISFPAHLWMLGSIGLFSICAINVLSELA